MSDTNQGDSSAPETPPPATSGGGGKDVGAAIKGMQMAEKILAGAAVAFLLGFMIDNRWRALFKFSSKYYEPWMHTLGFIGAVGVLVLIGTKLFGVKLVDEKLYPKLVVLAAVLPAVGMLIQELSNFWSFAMLLGIIGMAYAGAKITTRDRLLK